MLIDGNSIRISHGPKENRHRPAVDPLFRSAALNYGPRVVGVVLTGALDDGTAGLLAIKRRSGLTIVQNPEEAFASGMPRSAVQHVKVDYMVSLAAIGPLLTNLVYEQAYEGEIQHVAPLNEENSAMEGEVKMAEMNADLQDLHQHVGTPSVFSCPECGGVLWEVQDGDLLRFRCRVGHAYSSESALAEQSKAVEQALWVALKALSEKATLLQRMSERARQREHTWLAEHYDHQMIDTEQHAARIKQVLQQGDSMLPDNSSLEKSG